MNLKEELTALCAKWRARADQCSREADEASLRQDHRSVWRLAAMASTLRWAALDLSIYLKDDT